MSESNVRVFNTTVVAGARGRVYIELPFDASEAWGAKATHHVNGSVNLVRIRGPLVQEDGTYRLLLGPAWRRDCGIAAGDEVSVMLAPEGPQLGGLPEDVAAALDAEPDARAFFDSLATFYRKGYLTWLAGSARRPEVRKQRLQEFISLLKDGRKTR